MSTIMMRGALATAAMMLAAPVMAHITLETQQAPIKSTYKGVLRVGHGCEGASSLKIRVRIPDGVVNVKPMPKPGWALDTVGAPYRQPIDHYGERLSEGVVEISWTGKLLDQHYDEFTFRAYLSDRLKPDTILYFPAVQECEGGKTDRWIEIPVDGRSADDYKYPAPGLKLTPVRSGQ